MWHLAFAGRVPDLFTPVSRLKSVSVGSGHVRQRSNPSGLLLPRAGL